MKLNERNIQHLINIKTVLSENGGRVDSGTMMRRLDEIQDQKKAEALKALAEGSGFLEPNFMRDMYRHNLSIIYNGGKSYCNVYDYEAFVALKSSQLSREKISHAVRKCQVMCKNQVTEIFNMLDEQERLNALINTEDSTNYLEF